MNRWAVDVTGINLDADLRLEDTKHGEKDIIAHKKSMKLFSREEEEEKKEHDIGDVCVLLPDELLQGFINRQAVLEEATSPLASSLRSALLSNHRSSIFVPIGDVSSSLPQEVSTPIRKELRVYNNFFNPGDTQLMNVVAIKQPNYCGVDVVNAFLQKLFTEHPEQVERFSNNPRHYKLYIADEYTGEAEMAVILDRPAKEFITCYTVQALPAARIYMFPVRKELLPTTAHDINILVNIKPLDPTTKPVQRMCCVPSDMLAESLEALLTARLPSNAVVQGSLRIKYGPVELNINEFYNFGAGCGSVQCPVSEYTLLSLHRFGVTEVSVNGRVVEASSAEAAFTDPMEDIVIDMDVDEALSFQQFEVISINRYGARQQRLLCVDGEHIYTMRPNADANTATTERTIKDIEDVCTDVKRPKYLEIIYTKASKFDVDHLECTTTYNRALLEEKSACGAP
ncbi:hypothetical protein STCU_08772 [Strigomonas culicis]|uniref:SIN1-type PH domain-containing protein n=1 Tax=Strigomonas culicis TaxID=28005 RepID=S9TWE6_9TRYP|nr:hypothetical protein STCU_08772 [Strigomonas culicis]|eukprot:EPY20928.1 hypothetical protein STCU_08772 [Strigomonas culicis]